MPGTDIDSMLLLYSIGRLQEVQNLTAAFLTDSSIQISWIPPFTLDITGVDPDIIYCVDVSISRGLSFSELSMSQCGINETEFIFMLPPRNWCYFYHFTVTPVNPVGNGTSSSLDISNQTGKYEGVCSMVHKNESITHVDSYLFT